MKASIKLVFVVMLFAALITGCKKSQTSENPKDNSHPIDLQKIESLVRYCTNRVNSPIKTTDSIPADSLQYYLAAAANYTYGIASAHGELQKIDSNFFKVPCVNNKIALTDVNSVYTALIDSVRASFRRIQDQNKNLVVVTTSPATVQSNKALFKVTSIILYGNNYQVGLFDTTDYWRYGGAYNCSGGKCGPYSGYDCLDAAIELQNRIMLRKGTSSGCFIPPYPSVYVTPGMFPNPNHSGPANYFSFYLFANTQNAPMYHECLMPYEINRYLLYGEHVVYTSDTDSDPGARPDGYSFMYLTLQGVLVVGNGDILHVGYCHYGVYIPGGYNTPL